MKSSARCRHTIPNDDDYDDYDDDYQDYHDDYDDSHDDSDDNDDDDDNLALSMISILLSAL